MSRKKIKRGRAKGPEVVPIPGVEHMRRERQNSRVVRKYDDCEVIMELLGAGIVIYSELGDYDYDADLARHLGWKISRARNAVGLIVQGAKEARR